MRFRYRRTMSPSILSVVLVFATSAAALAAEASPEDEAKRQAGVAAAMGPTERSEQDKARDADEKPQAIAEFAALKQGLTIADIHAGDGYVTEVLMGSVTPYGKVYANNDPALLSAAEAQAWEKRLESPDTADLVQLEKPLSQPLPYYAKALHAVFSIGAYHHTVSRGIDRRALHQTIFDSLTPGAVYIVVDARAGKAADDAKAAASCRTRPELVREEVEAVGFRFVAESDALEIAGDGRTSDACSRKVLPDRFMLKFERPAS
ncbi:MAG TPA: hypothetical protein VEL28_07290 [Candidatus Binatia bacterium]|nr:hypothetical protein [Candidatus Binatia bacterium]